MFKKKPSQKRMTEIAVQASENYIAAQSVLEHKCSVSELAAVSVGVMTCLEKTTDWSQEEIYLSMEKAKEYLVDTYGDVIIR